MRKSGNRVAVVGAGIVGVLCASELLREGQAVTLVDRVDPGEGCSSGTACMISPDAVVPYNSPSSLWLIPRWLMDPRGPLSVRLRDLPGSLPWLAAWVRASSYEGSLRTGRGMAALHGGSVDAYAKLLGEIRATDLLRRTGQIQVSRSSSAFTATAVARRLREEFGVRTKLLDARLLREMVPALSDEFKSGILFPNNGHTLSSGRLVKTFAEQFCRGGGTFVKKNVKGFCVTDAKVAGLLVSDGTIQADRIVLAAGIDSRELLRRVGTDVPLQAERGYHLTLAEPGIELPCPVSNKDQSFAVTPMEDGIRFAGTVEIASSSSRPNWKRAEMLAAAGKQMFPGLRIEPSTRWMGSRPSFPDGLPILGPHPRLANLLLAFGNGHYGLTAAPKMAGTITALIAARPPPIDIRPYSPTRF